MSVGCVGMWRRIGMYWNVMGCVCEEGYGLTINVKGGVDFNYC